MSTEQPMTQVIVVEDHPDLLEDVVFGLNAEGLQARGAADGRQLDALSAQGMPDVLVLDLMLPGEDGMAIARRVRGRGEIGIVMLTARGQIEDRVAGLELADAYLVKPVDLRELAAVVRSVHRRLRGAVGEPPWVLRESRMELLSPGGVPLALTYKEYRVLAALAQAPGQVVGMKSLAEALETDWLSFEKNRLELVIARLRRKIGAAMSEPMNPIKAARSEGYVFTLPIERMP